MTFVSLYIRKVDKARIMANEASTIRQSAMQMLTENTFLKKLLDSAGEGIIISDRSGRIAVANRRAGELFAYSVKELLGMRVEQLIPMRFRTGHAQKRHEYLNKPRTRSMGQGLDLSGLRKDQSEFPLEVSLSHVKHGDKDWVVSFIIDISKRKAHEEEILTNRRMLKEYATKLEEKVKDRTQELEHMNLGLLSQVRERKIAEEALKKSLSELKEARREALSSLEKERELNELKSRFISMASHEFRTPLTTIASSANLMLRYPEKEQQAQREKHGKRIKNAVNNLVNILNDFLSLEKLEGGYVEVNCQPIAVKDFLEELQDSLSQVLKQGQELVVDNQLDSDHFESDPHLLNNILINLLSNAAKYSHEAQPITLRLRRVDNDYEFAVEDRGIGIPPEEQEKLFQRFFRAKNAANLQGTGLGLTIVKRYVDLLKGSIHFKSEENKGSTFVVRFPR